MISRYKGMLVAEIILLQTVTNEKTHSTFRNENICKALNRQLLANEILNTGKCKYHIAEHSTLVNKNEAIKADIRHTKPEFAVLHFWLIFG